IYLDPGTARVLRRDTFIVPAVRRMGHVGPEPSRLLHHAFMGHIACHADDHHVGAVILLYMSAQIVAPDPFETRFAACDVASQRVVAPEEPVELHIGDVAWRIEGGVDLLDD